MLDVSSQTCFLTSQCANNLLLKINKTNTSISPLDDKVLTVKGYVEGIVANKDGGFEREINMLDVKKIADLIPQIVRVDEKISN